MTFHEILKKAKSTHPTEHGSCLLVRRGMRLSIPGVSLDTLTPEHGSCLGSVLALLQYYILFNNKKRYFYLWVYFILPTLYPLYPEVSTINAKLKKETLSRDFLLFLFSHESCTPWPLKTYKLQIFAI